MTSQRSTPFRFFSMTFPGRRRREPRLVRASPRAQLARRHAGARERVVLAAGAVEVAVAVVQPDQVQRLVRERRRARQDPEGERGVQRLLGRVRLAEALDVGAVVGIGLGQVPGRVDEPHLVVAEVGRRVGIAVLVLDLEADRVPAAAPVGGPVELGLRLGGDLGEAVPDRRAVLLVQAVGHGELRAHRHGDVAGDLLAAGLQRDRVALASPLGLQLDHAGLRGALEVHLAGDLHRCARVREVGDARGRLRRGRRRDDQRDGTCDDPRERPGQVLDDRAQGTVLYQNPDTWR
jgi:hypothetical protein